MHDEDCEITVAGSGILGSCPVFDVDPSDGLTLPDGRRYDNVEIRCFSIPGCLVGPDVNKCPSSATKLSDCDDGCPTGAALAVGDTLTWHSNGDNQGGWNGHDGDGLPHSVYGAGGGWQICFA
jgi:hypothetical protein